MLVNTSITLPDLVLNQFLSNVFIESGSYDGRTIQQALNAGFEHIVSIELNSKYFQQCKERFAGNDKVTLYQGDSINVLPIVLAKLEQQATFWLDAHIQEGVKGAELSPLMTELRMIREHHIKNHIIMIDDVRLMGSRTWGYQCNKKDVMRALKAINPEYEIILVDSKAAIQDIMVAYAEN